MFRKLFNKADAESAAAPADQTESAAQARQEWDARLQVAQGDDDALLAIAIETPVIDVKIAAVMALASEAVLKQAEREFRTHDRRVHREAKQRYQAAVTLRETRQRADELIAEATTLGGDATIPVNRLVELDHAWRALDSALLDAAQSSRFADLRALLADKVRDVTERKRALDRWSADAKSALAQWHSTATQVAGVKDGASTIVDLRAALADVGSMLATLLDARPGDPTSPADGRAVATLSEAIAGALQERSRLDEQLTQAAQADQKREERQRSSDQDKAAKAANSARQEQAQARLKAQTQALVGRVEAAEAALAAGHLVDALKHLPALQAALDASGLGKALHDRIERLQAEIVRLKGWQRWGGGRVREDLVEEAETLARSVAAAEGGGDQKLPVAQLEKYIDQLRERWKELDRLGGATGKPLWQRFDDALKAAHGPVAEHKLQLKAARVSNLAAREELLAGLDRVRIDVDANGVAPDWKQVVQTLQQFQNDWRKLGPLQHTVPHKKLSAVEQRMQAAVARVTNALDGVRDTARTQREALVARAKTLAEQATGRDLMPRLRELQSQWQQHARSLPLPHKLENALWAEFKAAIDGVMSRREAVFSAQRAGFEANHTAREALIARLAALAEDSPAAEIKRTLAAVDGEWRGAGEMAKDQSARLNARYHAARDAAQQLLAGAAQRSWSQTCNSLLAKLALCDELEAGEGGVTADLESRWSALPPVPPRWEKVLIARFNHGQATDNVTGEAIDGLLLQLESGLDIPSPPSVEAQRRHLKLLAVKHALETRPMDRTAPPDLDQTCAELFGQRHFSAAQKERLVAIVNALRRTGGPAAKA